MSELTTIDTNNYAAMAQMTGMAFDTGESKGGLARLRINKKAIMGQVELNGKMVKTELVAAGAMALEYKEDAIYADSVTIRPFVQRFMYQRYDSDKNNYMKTVMADQLDIDLKDTVGTFNCGKPGGYIKDFDALPDGTKEIIRQIRRVRVVLGTISISGVTKAGDAMDVEDLPCVWEVDSKEGFKNVGQVFTKLNQMKHLPFQHTMEVSTEKRELPTGAEYYVPVSDLDIKNNIEFRGAEDQAIFTDFMQYIERFNTWVLAEWDKSYKQEDTADPVVEEFITVEVADVD